MDGVDAIVVAGIAAMFGWGGRNAPTANRATTTFVQLCLTWGRSVGERPGMCAAAQFRGAAGPARPSNVVSVRLPEWKYGTLLLRVALERLSQEFRLIDVVLAPVGSHIQFFR